MDKQQPSQNPSCMDEYDPESMLMHDALGRVCAAVETVAGIETLSITAALDRVLATPVKSTIDIPPYTNSAMDGYAINSTDIPSTGETSLRIVGTVLAGAPLTQQLNRGECARIMTGGKLPEGADSVIMQEHVQLSKDAIIIDSQHRIGQNVRHRGEDITVNQVVLEQGKRITAGDLGLLASLGIEKVSVRKPIKAAVFATGDELVALGAPLKDGQIYDSNRYAVNAMLRRFGANIIDLGIINDNRINIETAFLHASQQADVLITTGGVSVGDADFVKETLQKLGSVDFWKIAMKPGKPLAFGKVNRCIFFGLPGNPVSTMVTFYLFVLPALKLLQGESILKPLTLKARCLSTLRKTPGRIEFQRGYMQNDDTGELVVSSVGGQGSHMLSSMSKANCFIILPLESTGAQQNSMVTIQPFSDFI